MPRRHLRTRRACRLPAEWTDGGKSTGAGPARTHTGYPAIPGRRPADTPCARQRRSAAKARGSSPPETAGRVGSHCRPPFELLVPAITMNRAGPGSPRRCWWNGSGAIGTPGRFRLRAFGCGPRSGSPTSTRSSPTSRPGGTTCASKPSNRLGPGGATPGAAAGPAAHPRRNAAAVRLRGPAPARRYALRRRDPGQPPLPDLLLPKAGCGHLQPAPGRAGRAHHPRTGLCAGPVRRGHVLQPGCRPARRSLPPRPHAVRLWRARTGPPQRCPAGERTPSTRESPSLPFLAASCGTGRILPTKWIDEGQGYASFFTAHMFGPAT